MRAAALSLEAAAEGGEQEAHEGGKKATRQRFEDRVSGRIEGAGAGDFGAAGDAGGSGGGNRASVVADGRACDRRCRGVSVVSAVRWRAFSAGAGVFARAVVR